METMRDNEEHSWLDLTICEMTLENNPRVYKDSHFMCLLEQARKEGSLQDENANSQLVSVLGARRSLLGSMVACRVQTPYKRRSCYVAHKESLPLLPVFQKAVQGSKKVL